jgi:VIT1/CCC1 family predicted Fe2+/Mn2+ transporter
MLKFRDFSFGATSAVMTSLAIIIGLSNTFNEKITIITALLIIAIADNISDSFGIHIHEESHCKNQKEVRRITNYNFITRLLITFVFILFVLFMPNNLAIIFSISFSILVLVSLSYSIAKSQKTNPYSAIFYHLIIAFIVIIASFLLREIIIRFVTLH